MQIQRWNVQYVTINLKKKTEIEIHASTCSPTIVYEDEEETIYEDDNRHSDDFVPSPPQDEISVDEHMEEITKAQEEVSTQSLRTIRHKAWNKYVEHVEKKWFRPTATLQITFIGENAVAVGDGPQREFFQGI